MLIAGDRRSRGALGRYAHARTRQRDITARYSRNYGLRVKVMHPPFLERRARDRCSIVVTRIVVNGGKSLLAEWVFGLNEVAGLI